MYLRISTREEESVAFGVFPHTGAIVSGWVKILPSAGRIYVLVLFVPATINHLCKRCVRFEAFEFRFGNKRKLRLWLGNFFCDRIRYGESSLDGRSQVL